MSTPEQTNDVELAPELDTAAVALADEENDLLEDEDDAEFEAEFENMNNREESEDLPVLNLSPEDQLRAVEAILFASREPMTPNAIRDRLPEGADVGGLLLALREKYADAGVQLLEKEGTWSFRTAADLADVMRVKKEVQRKLSRSAMETLAIVAYHQPVTRAEIENIRGVATNKGTLDILMEVGWVRPGRRRETPGRPLTWVTTAAFMDHFGLSSLMDLPGLDELKSSGLLDRRPAIETIGGTGDLFGDNDSEDLKQAAADLEADAEEESLIEAAYEEEVSDEEWEAAQADETPIDLNAEESED